MFGVFRLGLLGAPHSSFAHAGAFPFGSIVADGHPLPSEGPLYPVGCTGDEENHVVGPAHGEPLAVRFAPDGEGGGEAHKQYNGKVFCFIETALDKATYITFDYENPPKPVTPSKMVHFAKVGYNNMHWVNLKGIM
ncbi:MAG: hypothetical protein LOD92_04800 [Bacillales bacterium]